jgi:hypothetical protein
VNTRLDQNQTELAILVLSVALEVLSDGDSLELQPISFRLNERKQSDIIFTFLISM